MMQLLCKDLNLQGKKPQSKQGTDFVKKWKDLRKVDTHDDCCVEFTH